MPEFETRPLARLKPEKVNILVVDDLPEKHLVYRSILEELGQNLITASSGEDALKLLLKHEFAVILLDVNMPGIDGFETANLIRRRKKSAHTPIIFLTAFLDEMYAAQGYASGAVDYLQTPVVPEILRAKVRVFIELFQMRRQAAMQAEEFAKRTAAEESAQRWAFLVEVSQSLAKAHSPQEILSIVGRESIPFLADACVACTQHEDSGARKTEWHGQYSKNGEMAGLPPLPWLEESVNRVFTTGEYQIVPCNDSSVEGCALVLPLTISGKVQGTVTFIRNHAHTYSSANVYLAKQVVSRVSTALENIMLIQRIQEADQRKDEFLGMLAHELRNPLAPISNAVHLLRMMGQKEPRLAQVTEIVDRQVTHMSRLIDDLLDATRLARGKILLRKERCDLCAIVQQTAKDYQSIFDARGITLNIDVPDCPLWVEGDPTRLTQAIGNLLHNAHKFTDSGGSVSVKLAYDVVKASARITIRDTGIGIEREMLPYVFDVFRQADQGLDRSRGGLGLGLALVKGLVSLHEGSVTATSEGPGKGTEFIIDLPAPALTRETPQKTPIAPARLSQQYRILIIEDNPDTAESARMLLSLEGYDVKTAHNGNAGLQLARDFRPQIILCDIGLPEMDGYQVAKALRQDPALAKVYAIALTGYGREEDQNRAIQAGFDMHLTKPIDYGNLHQALARLADNDSHAPDKGRKAI